MASKDLKETGFKGGLGKEIALFLWPEIELDEPTDGAGVDDLGRAFGYYAGAKVQVRFDERIAQTNKIWVEFLEKTLGFSEQPWRWSPHDCAWFIFVTIDSAMLISVDVIGRIIANRRLLMENIPGPLDSEGVFIFRGECQRLGCEERTYELNPENIRRWQQVTGKRWPGSHAAELVA